MKILVTGGAGFIGSHLVDQLLSEGHEVKVLDNLHSGNVDNLKQHREDPSFRFIKGDIRDDSDVRKAVKGVEAVFHEAAITSVPISVENPELTWEVNVDGTLNLIEKSLAEDVERFVFASSCAVYGEAEDLPIGEDSKLKTASPYAESKIAGEEKILQKQEEQGLNPIIFRYFNVYGPRQGGGRYAGVITKFLKRLDNGEPPIIFGDGEQTRDFVYIKDIVNANLLALEKRQTRERIFNVGFGEEVSINKLCEMLLKLTGKSDLEPVYKEARSGDIRYSRADLTRIRKDLEYNPKIPLKEGLRKLIEKCEFDLST
ncbi:hypothetical protein AKJ37_07685 [candidate division MSBL1 archaeon SCGC-AAA259I09]|uniref:NAD-dependent epimerase/dehydratase domain-containing protein n=1 Tax=candidate division MSBL1 archaeon SCGC-AAA259I09 TaxID=1698267 RepID=A0A133UJL2_9EURY|nr:hypothetical protein AKJ37_07685 [candidate division MSBL1 archaeon SCGC-AAA259I09]